MRSGVFSRLTERAFRIVEGPLNLRWSLTSRRCSLDVSGNFLLFADPRGGSTWLAETLQAGLDLELLWEPLQPRLVPQWGVLGFGWRQYIPQEAVWPEARDTFERLLGGRLLNRHICRYTTPERLLAAECVLMKFCRGNALLPWLTKQFPFTHAPILLLRHPFAVVASQMKHGNWDRVSTYRFDPNAPFSGRERRHAEFLGTLRTRAELLTASWCLANSVVLEQPPNARPWITVFYEELIQEPEVELARIFERWDMKLPNRVLEAVRRPSSMTKDSSALHDPRSQVSKWQRQIPKARWPDLLAILEHFGVDVYSDSPMPHGRR